MLKQRIFTALLLLLVFLGALFLVPAPGFLVLVTLVTLIGFWEWSNLSGFESKKHRVIYFLCSALGMVVLGYYTSTHDAEAVAHNHVRTILLIAATWWGLALLWVQGYPSSALLWGNRCMRGIIGWVVLLPTWMALLYLKLLSNGALLILLVVLVVNAADTGAYFFGRAFGKKKLAVEVSPGKSWEGFWGGLFCCALFAFVVSWLTETEDHILVYLVLIPAALVSVLGDLFESMLKRHRGIKDSGHILPGHGGVLDRLDSLTAAVPVFALCVVLSGWSL